MTYWPLDHPFWISIVIAPIVVTAAVFLHRILQERLASTVVTILMGVLVVVPLTHLFAVSREREAHRLTLRQTHLGQLQSVLRTEAEKLAEVARRVDVEGRVTDVHKPAAADVELTSLLFPDILSRDVANHYPEYSEEKIRLQRTIVKQEKDFAETVSVIGNSLSLQPLIERRRLEIALSVLEKCLDKGPGITVTRSANGYTYRSRMETNSVGGYPGVPIAPEHSAALAAFESFQPTTEITGHCRRMKRGGAVIAANAKSLSSTARGLSERTTLPGPCKYTRLD